jgi:hypothetical protein
VTAQSDRGWVAHHAKWLAPAAVLAALALFAGLILLGICFISGSMKSNDACREALARAKAHLAVQAALGTPVEDGIFVVGKISEGDATGTVDVGIPLYGTKRNGSLGVVAAKSGGIWRFSTLVVEVDGTGEGIDLKAGIPAEAVPGTGR